MEYDILSQEMEEEVNIHYKELVMEKSRDQLLTNQLQRLAMCFDVYLETETVNTAREGPVEISREKVFTRVARYLCIFDSFHSRSQENWERSVSVLECLTGDRRAVDSK